MKWTTASNSFLVTQYLLSVLNSVRLAYAITRSFPLISCESTVPIEQLLASVSRMNRLDTSGNASIGADINLFRRFSKALCASCVH